MKRIALLLAFLPAVSLAAYVPAVTEVLVLASAATILPQTDNRRAIEIQNLGPNPIYCAFSSSAAVVTKSRKIGTGESWSLNHPPNVAIYCKAATADQVTGAATIVTEI